MLTANINLTFGTKKKYPPLKLQEHRKAEPELHYINWKLLNFLFDIYVIYHAPWLFDRK